MQCASVLRLPSLLADNGLRATVAIGGEQGPHPRHHCVVVGTSASAQTSSRPMISRGVWRSSRLRIQA